MPSHIGNPEVLDNRGHEMLRDDRFNKPGDTSQEWWVCPQCGSRLLLRPPLHHLRFLLSQQHFTD